MHDLPLTGRRDGVGEVNPRHPYVVDLLDKVQISAKNKGSLQSVPEARSDVLGTAGWMLWGI